MNLSALSDRSLDLKLSAEKLNAFHHTLKPKSGRNRIFIEPNSIIYEIERNALSG